MQRDLTKSRGNAVAPITIQVFITNILWGGPAMTNKLPGHSTNQPPPSTWNGNDYYGTPGHKIIISIKTELGTSKTMFSLEHTKWSALLTGFWVKTLWKFCHKRKIISGNQTFNHHLKNARDITT